MMSQLFFLGNISTNKNKKEVYGAAGGVMKSSVLAMFSFEVRVRHPHRKSQLHESEAWHKGLCWQYRFGKHLHVCV